MFEKIKAKIEELKAELESAVNADEIKADEAAIGLLQGWVDGLTAFKRVLENKEKPAISPEGTAEDPGSEAPAIQVQAPSEEPAQEAKGDASKTAPESV